MKPSESIEKLMERIGALKKKSSDYLSDSGSSIRDPHEEEIEKIAYQLKERVKELDCMFAISRLIENPDLSEDELLQSVVELFSGAFQYPEDTCIRLSFDGKVYRTKNFFESDLKLSAALVVDGLDPGSLEVFLPDEQAEPEEKTFLAEERNIIEAVSLSVSRYLNRRRIQKQLKESRENLRITLDSIGDAVITTDIEERITGLNPVAEKLTGWTIDEAAGKPLEKVFNIINAHNGEKAENPVKRVLEEGLVVGLANHTKLISKSGVAHQVSDSAAPIKTDSGDIEGVVMVFRDITESYLMQEELAQREKHLRKALQIGNTGSWLFNLKSGKIEISEEFCRICGLDKKREYTIEDIQEVPLPEYRQMLDKALKRLIMGKESYDVEYKIMRPSDGCIMNVHSIAEYNQKEKTVTGFIQDISERKKLMKELVVAKEKAEVSERLKSAFLANMGHEIRTPMNGILGFTGLLKNPDLASEQKDKYIDIIHTSGQRMINTVNDIIELSRIEAGSIHLEINETNVHRKIEDHILFFSHEAEEKGLSLVFDNGHSADGCVILTDQVKLDSILSNLIKNAVKYTRAGEIHVGYRKKEKRYEFYVKDTGVGIPKERQEAVFSRFEQADNSETRPYEGSGLGLTIAKFYVEMLGGKIWLESEVDRGSVFYFSLPCSLT
jgi:PAS domain S-box-containing protein